MLRYKKEEGNMPGSLNQDAPITCRDESIFCELKEAFNHTVELENNTIMNTVGQGNIQISLNGVSPSSLMYTISLN